MSPRSSPRSEERGWCASPVTQPADGRRLVQERRRSMAPPHPMLLPLAAGRDVGDGFVLDDTVVVSAAEHGMQGLLWSWARRHPGGGELRERLTGYALVAQRRHARFW